ncbi:hypothetical protein Q5P01_021830 [Channa striata]|uniref:G-protein coupled receptors family 1 profile domain-containing protein n=1 Tax=Channa striata TaxID=64152 RepID=A0AA88LUY6_CHASR|nr:hypothetical protein Q5P01_021830 [Channa striata]
MLKLQPKPLKTIWLSVRQLTSCGVRGTSDLTSAWVAFGSVQCKIHCSHIIHYMITMSTDVNYVWVRKDHGAPIYIINLLISDLIQLCSMTVSMIESASAIHPTLVYIYIFGLLASVGFMACVSLERYLVIAWPVWYHFRQTVKFSVMVQKENVAPIYVINLLISDLIQLCSLTVLMTGQQIFMFIYIFGGLASIGFMACVSLERYLVIARPMWYHFRQTVKFSVIVCVVVWILPLVMQKENVAPIYVINLLISDLIQLCSMTVVMTGQEIFINIYIFGLLASVGFMACVSLERYLVIARPMWYHFRQTVKFSVIVCVVVWILPLVVLVSPFFLPHFEVIRIIAGVYLLVPFPLFIFSLCGTLKALSAASRVPPDEKRRIVAMLVLVLLIYTLLFLPSIIWFLAKKTRKNNDFSYLRFILVFFSPLADSFLYVLLRKGAVDKVLASVCCCRMESNDVNRSTQLSEVNVHT